MELRVIYKGHTSDRPGQRDRHSELSDCFVSLPTEVSRSLLEKSPGIDLVVIRLQLESPKIGDHANNPNYVYAGWAGGVVAETNGLGMHNQFASCLGVREGDVVKAQVVAQMLRNHLSHVILSAVLRPAALGMVNEQGDRFSQIARQSKGTTRHQFALLCETAAVLEHTLITQIRILYPGLVFPLSLPGGGCVAVEVVHIDVSRHSKDVQGQYGILMPDAEIVVESAPAPLPTRNSLSSVTTVLRAIPYDDALIDVAQACLLTHAVIPATFLTSGKVRHAVVSRKNDGAGNVTQRFPVAFLCHGSVPNGHVWLPPFLWSDLVISPLTPVFFEEVSLFDRGASPTLLRYSDAEFPTLPSLHNILETSGVYYSGMKTRTGWLVLPDTDVESPRTVSGRKSAGDNNYPADSVEQSSMVDDWQCVVRRNNLIDGSLPTERDRGHYQECLGFRGDPEQIPATSDDNPASMPKVEHANVVGSLPTSDQSLDQLFRGLTASCRKGVCLLLERTGSVLEQTNRSCRSSNAFLIDGPQGSGKSLVCKTVAFLLRRFALARTIWISCGQHARETPEALQLRIRQSFDQALDGGPGVVVFDDWNLWSDGKGTEQADPHDIRSGGGSQIGTAAELASQLLTVQEHPIVVLLTCYHTTVLHQILRAPGLVRHTVSLGRPYVSERAFVHRNALRQKSEMASEHVFVARRGLEETSHSSCIKPRPRQKRPHALTRLTEGFSPRQIESATTGATLAALSQCHRRLNLRSVMKDHLAEFISEKGVDVARLQDEMAEWSWQKVGGAEEIRRAFHELITMPSLHRDVFSKPPIKLPKGLLLYGPPGCGKTLIARAGATESGLHTIFIKGPELMSKYIGESEGEVRRSFSRAVSLAPCILIFDEFDSLAPRRGRGTGVSDRVVNTLLTCMDGAERLSEDLYVIATSCRPDLIDPAVLRPGRIDRWISIEPPVDANERYDILLRLSSNYFPRSDALHNALHFASNATDGFTGADLGAVVNDVYLELEREGRTLPLSERIPGSFEAVVRRSRPSLTQSQHDHFLRATLQFKSKDHVSDRSILSQAGQRSIQKIALQ